MLYPAKLNKISLGLLFLVSGLILLSRIYYPVAREEVNYKIRQSGDEQTQAEYRTQCPPSEWQIDIPQLGICSSVVPNVNPFDSSIYQSALARGVAHATGTALPGESGNIFLFAHSSASIWDATRYNSIFYLLNKAQVGGIITMNYQGKTYKYSIDNKKIVEPSTVGLMTRGQENKLTLMTCWPPGTTAKRLVVTAVETRATE